MSVIWKFSHNFFNAFKNYSFINILSVNHHLPHFYWFISQNSTALLSGSTVTSDGRLHQKPIAPWHQMVGHPTLWLPMIFTQSTLCMLPFDVPPWSISRNPVLALQPRTSMGGRTLIYFWERGETRPINLPYSERKRKLEVVLMRVIHITTHYNPIIW